MEEHACPKHGTAHSILATPGTPEQAFCGRSFHCEVCGPQGGSTLYPSPELQAQLTDAEAEAIRDREIEAFLAGVSAKRFAELCTVQRRGRDFKVSVRHEVGLGGSLNFTVRNMPTKEAAIDCVRKDIKGRVR